MAEDKQPDLRRVTLKNVRLSFTDALREKKRSHPTGPLKFGCNFINETAQPEFAANERAIKRAIEAAETKEFGEKGVGKIARTVDDPKRIAYRAGEKFKNKEGEIYGGYANNFGLTTKAERRPNLWDRHKRDVEVEDIEDVFQAGFYCDAIVSFYCTSKEEQGGNGLFASVEAIRSRQTGETFGAGNNTKAEDFEDLADEDDGIGGEVEDDLLAT